MIFWTPEQVCSKEISHIFKKFIEQEGKVKDWNGHLISDFLSGVDIILGYSEVNQSVDKEITK